MSIEHGINRDNWRYKTGINRDKCTGINGIKRDNIPVYDGIKRDNIPVYDGINGITPYRSYPVSHPAIPVRCFYPGRGVWR